MINMPLQINKIEILNSDPKGKKEGTIWFNRTENVIKFYNGDEISVILSDKSFEDSISKLIDEKINKTFFKFKIEDTKIVKIKHNFNTKLFYVSVYDEKEKSIISVTANVIDENNIQIEFLENLTGYVLINFYNE